MNDILWDNVGRKSNMCLDNVIIVGYNLENHLENLRLVLKRLFEFNKLDKCEFLKRENLIPINWKDYPMADAKKNKKK